MSEKHFGNLNAGRWTPEHDVLLRKLREDGISAAQIGVRINLECHTVYTRNSVIGRCHRLGLAAKLPVPPPKLARTYARNKVGPTFKAGNLNNLRCVEANPRNISLIDLEKDDCRWPYGDGPFTFCGSRVLPDFPYCAAHMRLSMHRQPA